ncbi:MAG: pitrilysin family protein [Planctomycetota bacterium]
MPVSFEQRTLDNGLTVIAEVDPEADSSASGFFVRTGARDEQPALMGVSHFLEHMMFKGTDTLSAEDINEGFDRLGARNNAYTSTEMTCFYAHSLPEHQAGCLDLLAKMMRPALRQTDFDTEKGVILEEIAMYKDNPFWVLYEALCEQHYRGHTLGHRVLGTDDTIKALERDAMQAYFDARYSADNTVLALAGRVDFDQACRQAETLCGSWNTTGAERNSSEPETGSMPLRLTDERVNRAYLLGLARAPSYGDERRYAASLLAKLLGDSDNSRLHWALIETGIAEEAQAAYDPHDGTGSYFIYASTDPENADDVAEVLTNEAQRVLEGTTDADLERLRAKTATGVTVGGERPNDRMQRLGRQWTYLGAYTPLEVELERIRAVTLDDLSTVFEAFPLAPSSFGTLTPAEPSQS